MGASCFATYTSCGSIWLLRGGSMAGDGFAASADAMKLRKKFRKETARRQRFVGHARKLNDVPKTTADRATL
jgi:hypothetical protein